MIAWGQLQSRRKCSTLNVGPDSAEKSVLGQNTANLAEEMMARGWQAGTLGRQICAQAWPTQAQGSSAMLRCRSEACSEAVPCCHCYKPARRACHSAPPVPWQACVIPGHIDMLTIHILLCSQQ